MDLSRRMLLALSAAGGAVAANVARAASFGNPDEPPEGAINSTPSALSDPGPQNPALANQFPSFQNPPPTDVGDMPMMWSSFNIAPKRIQAGGWAREVTAETFPISTEIAGVNMRLGPGGIRELHWHLAAEWGIVTNGLCRVTILDTAGRAYVQDVGPGEIWYFPAGQPHSLQGVGPDGCEFVIVFDNGRASEFNTLLVTDWLAHTPPDILAQNFGAPAEVFKNIPLHDLWIFQGKEAGPLAADQAAVAAGGARRYPSLSAGRVAARQGKQLGLGPPRRQHQLQGLDDDRVGPVDAEARRVARACTGTPMRTSGNTGSRAKAA